MPNPNKRKAIKLLLEWDEEIKPLYEFKNYYITSFGRVWRQITNDGRGWFLSPYKNFRGYRLVCFSVGGKIVKRCQVHRLVCEYFILNPGHKPQVNHKDGNKENNVVGNLEWVTPSENSIHAFRTGLNTNYGQRVKTSKLTDDDVRSIRKRIDSGETLVSISKDFKVSSAMIGYIARGKWWKHLTGEAYAK